MKSHSSLHACDVMKQVSGFPFQAMFIPTSSVCWCVVIVLVLQFWTLCVVIYTSALWRWAFVSYERGQGLFVARYIPWPFPAAVIWCSERIDDRVCRLCFAREIWKERFVLGRGMCVSPYSARWPPNSIPRVKARSVRTIIQSMPPVIITDVAFARIWQNICQWLWIGVNVLTVMQINPSWNSIRIRLTLFLSTKRLIYIYSFTLPGF